MNNCKDCKYWTLDTEYLGEDFTPDGTMPRTYKVCTQDNYECVDGPDCGIAYRTDAEFYDDIIYTGPLFGCVNFQESSK